MAHTPGPWVIVWDKYGKHSDLYAHGGNIVEPVCVIPHDDVTTAGMREVRANGRLIEAAPELLAAAKLACLNFKRTVAGGNFMGDDEHESWTALDAAIKVAEGKRNG